MCFEVLLYNAVTYLKGYVYLLYGQCKPQTNINMHLKNGNKSHVHLLTVVYFAYDLSSAWYSTQEVGESMNSHSKYQS